MLIYIKSDCKETGIRNLEFVAKTEFLYAISVMDFFENN